MTKDAKLGLVLGIAVVIVVAVVFFRKEPPTAQAGSEPAAAVKQTQPLASKAEKKAAPLRILARHTVVEGETLFALAQRYYGDSGKFIEIYQANRDRMASPERLPPGMVVVIPDLGQ